MCESKPSGRLHDGATITLNGSSYRLVVLAPQETALIIPERLPSGKAAISVADIEGLHGAVDLLKQAAQIVTAINERLVDSLDGLTTRGMWRLMCSAELSTSFRDTLRSYAFACLKYGTNQLPERGSVIVPPCSRSQFDTQIAKLSSKAHSDLPWARLIEHLFTSTPRVTQGFYLFESEHDFDRFETTLGLEYQRSRKELSVLFDRACEARDLDASEWRKLDELSQTLLERQKLALEAQMESASPELRSVATRVRIAYARDGKPQFRATPYAEEFSEQLSLCARLLRDAKQRLPSFAIEAQNVLGDLVAWCTDKSEPDAWAESRTSWIAASDPDSVIDINLSAEEKVSRLGTKGGLQLVVSSFESPPQALGAVYEVVRKAAMTKGDLNVVFLRQLAVGGGASNAVLAGEKLPDPRGRPQYKVMTFSNTVAAAMVRGNAELILHATEWPRDQMNRLEDTAKGLVLLHEYGHTLGDFADYLGDLGASVEEANAEASALYSMQRLSPNDVQGAAVLGACWTPVHRTLQGLTEPHSQADIALFGEYEQAGGVRVDRASDRTIVRVINTEQIVTTAFAIALRMRLWEAGIPTAHHYGLTELFDAHDLGQDERIARAAARFVETLDEGTRAAMRRSTLEEVREYFSLRRLESIVVPLRDVIQAMPAYQSMAVIPTDSRLATLLDSVATA